MTIEHHPLCSHANRFTTAVSITGEPFPCDCPLIGRVMLSLIELGWRDPEFVNRLRDIPEQIAQALERELTMSSRIPPPDDDPWDCGGLRIHGDDEVRADAAAIARRFKEDKDD
jgi:hypothetical protein